MAEGIRIKVVDEWRGFCPSCGGNGRLVLVERGPRWTVRELFGRTWTPRQDFGVHCRGCGDQITISRDELAAAARQKETAPARPADAPAVPRPRAAEGGLPSPRPAADDGMAKDRSSLAH